MKQLKRWLVPSLALAFLATSLTPVHAVTSEKGEQNESPRIKIEKVPAVSASDLKKTGDSLALFLQSVEARNWGTERNKRLAKIAPPSKLASKPLSKKSLAALASVESGLTSMSQDTNDQVDVTSASVKIESAEISQASPQGTVLTYEVEFLRDVVELPADQDWMEVIPYEVTLSPDTKSIQNIVAKDLEYQMTVEAPIGEITDETDGAGSSEDESSSAELPQGVTPAQFESGHNLPIATMALSTTKKQKVVDYALKWWNSKNSAYPTNYGNDCTNFVSQALKAGGWGQVTGLWTSNKSWWGRSWGPPYASYPWGGAENFYKFARNESKRTTHLSSVYSLVKGDVLQYKASGASNMTHTMVTTAKISGVPYLTSHTTNTRNNPFTKLKNLNVTWFAHRV